MVLERGAGSIPAAGNPLREDRTSSNILLKRHVHGPGADEPVAQYDGTTVGLSNRRYTLPDERGSIAALVNADGSPSIINTYDEFGIPAAANDGRFQYTGQAWIPELGMYYYKARIYSPTLGRFLQVDPVGYDDQINLYAYAGNDPVNGTDPSGTESCPMKPCPDISPPSPQVRETAKAESQRIRITQGLAETGVQIMVSKSNRAKVAQVRRGSASGRPDPNNPMSWRFHRILKTDRFMLGTDLHGHPLQGSRGTHSMKEQQAADFANRRNLFPSEGDFIHMNETNAPMFLKNSAGALLEVYRDDSIDHVRVIVPGREPLGAIPSDLQDVVVDPQ